jgi:Tfp pilus assembly protein PilX
LVLVCLLVAMLLGAELIRATAIAHRQVRGVEQRQQAFWLAESAVQRARHALAESPDYAGETWRIVEDHVAGGQAGLAVISVQPAEGSASGRLVRVQAYWPDDPVDRALCEREILVD